MLPYLPLRLILNYTTFLLASSTLIYTNTVAQAQLIPDDTLGAENSLVTNQQLRDLITGGAIRGENLFHSFSEFNINQGQQVYFANPSNIVNIFTRVTGNNPSHINGTLGVEGGANLFLLNPQGITFGRDAVLDISGSFFATTADSFVFREGLEFSTINPQTAPLLTVSITPGLQYGVNPEDIAVNQSNLTVNQGQTLSLVGGNVTVTGSGDITNLQGTVTAHGGKIELGGLTAAGRVSVNPDFSLVFPDGVARGDVSLANGATLNVVSNALGLNGGSVEINAQNISLTGDGAILAGIGAGFGGEGVIAGDINFNATGEIVISDSSNADLIPGELTQGRGVQNQLNQGSVGTGGHINIVANSLSLSNGSLVNTTNLGTGQTGSITVNARESIFINGSGNVRGGIVGGAFVGSQGNAGNIDITTNSLDLVEGGYIASSIFAIGNGGTITINADNIQASGFRDNINLSSGVYAQVLSLPLGDRVAGNGGNINITTNSLSLTDYAQINTDTGAIADGVTPIGDGGNINISAGILNIANNAGIRASSRAIGNGGNINLATDVLNMADNAAIQVSSNSIGNSGNITINATQSILIDGGGENGRSTIEANIERGATGNAGKISITTNSFDLINGGFVTSTTFGLGNGGTITIDADTIQAIGFRDNDTDLSSGFYAQTLFDQAEGNGGNINIISDSLSLTNFAQINATTLALGNAGNINLDSDNITLDEGIIQALVAEGAQGNGGNIEIISDFLTLTNGGRIMSSTFSQGSAGRLSINATNSVQIIGISPDGQSPSALLANANSGSMGDAGDVIITTSQLLIQNGAEVGAGTFAQGRGGNLTINATDSVQITNDSSLVVQSNTNSTAGNLTITTNRLNAQNNSLVSVSSPSGQAGNLDLTTNNLSLNNSKITAETGLSSEQGSANIALQVSELLLLENESLISATALENANGGNVTISAGFILALTPTNDNGSDISANAQFGNGGLVIINTEGLFGIEFKAINTPFNDITASSQFATAGVVEILQPNFNPASSVTALSLDTVDASQLIVRGCQGNPQYLSQFMVTGRGGLPHNHSELIMNETVLDGWVTLADNGEDEIINSASSQSKQASHEIVEATGWIINAQGKVILIADSSTPELAQSHFHTNQCFDD